MFTHADAARDAAKRLRKALFEIAGEDAPLHTCQSALAEVAGFNDWKHLIKTAGTVHAPKQRKSEGTADYYRIGASLQQHFQISFGEGEEIARVVFRRAPKPAVELDASLESEARSRLANLTCQPDELTPAYVGGHVGRARKGEKVDGLGASRFSLSIVAPFEDLLLSEVLVTTHLGKKRTGFARGVVLRTPTDFKLDFTEALAHVFHAAPAWFWHVQAMSWRDHVDTEVESEPYRVSLLISDLFIEPSYRSRGLGARLLDACCSVVEQQFGELVSLGLDVMAAASRIAQPASEEALHKTCVEKLTTWVHSLELGSGVTPKPIRTRVEHSLERTMFAAPYFLTGHSQSADLSEEVMADTLKGRKGQNRNPLPPVLYAESMPTRLQFLGTIGYRVSPHPDLMRFMPRALESIAIEQEPLDPALEQPQFFSQPSRFVYRFRNGKGMTATLRDIVGQPMSRQDAALTTAKFGQSEMDREVGCGEMAACLLNNSRLLFSDEFMQRSSDPFLVVLQFPQSGEMAVEMLSMEWPSDHLQARFMTAFDEAWAELSPEIQAWQRSFMKIALEQGYLERKPVNTVFQGKQALRFEFVPTPWKSPNTLRVEFVYGELAPGEPYRHCPAHASYRDHARMQLAPFARRAAEMACQKVPSVLESAVEQWGRLRRDRDPVLAISFLPGVWEKWTGLPYSLEKDLAKRRVKDLV